MPSPKEKELGPSVERWAVMGQTIHGRLKKLATFDTQRDAYVFVNFIKSLDNYQHDYGMLTFRQLTERLPPAPKEGIPK